jgi:hypothetical protein
MCSHGLPDRVSTLQQSAISRGAASRARRVFPARFAHAPRPAVDAFRRRARWHDPSAASRKLAADLRHGSRAAERQPAMGLCFAAAVGAVQVGVCTLSSHASQMSRGRSVYLGTGRSARAHPACHIEVARKACGGGPGTTKNIHNGHRAQALLSRRIGAAASLPAESTLETTKWPLTLAWKGSCR